ncbi:unnamed protein product [Protopolystoma xenopodis]|uniref:Uncharacterized protein n=1 Tax=Protopolystoma xenopodis TaxID=117903 RepID=A0A448XEE7_9PLAT|nr:unnamed protein product [Protopolystoma xenopodis]
MQCLDDYFALWSTGIEKLEDFLKSTNQIDEKIKFTMEVDEGERLPFLDVEMIFPKGAIKMRLTESP